MSMEFRAYRVATSPRPPPPPQIGMMSVYSEATIRRLCPKISIFLVPEGVVEKMLGDGHAGLVLLAQEQSSGGDVAFKSIATYA